MKKKVFLILLAFSTFSFGQNVQEVYQKAKIFYSQVEDLSRLDAMGVPVEHGIHKQGYFIISDFSISQLEKARENGFQVEVLIPDVKEHWLEQNRLGVRSQLNPECSGGSGIIEYETPDNFALGSMGGYFTYQEMLDQLDLMKSMYPDLITEKENISTFLTNGQPDNSTSPPIGGNGIKWVKISDDPNSDAEGEPQILYTAIHHAREPTSMSQLIFYMWYLLENYADDPEVQSIVNNTELYFVPVINPDGYLYNEKTDPNGGGFWRKNRFNGHGVDLNRNYDYYIDGDPNQAVWGTLGASSDPNSNTYRGSGPFSEVETQAMKWFVEQHEFIMAFNNHSYSELLLYPHGYDVGVLSEDDDLFSAVSEELVSQNGYINQLAADLYPASGNSDDFMYGTIGTHDKIFSMTPEIGTSFWLSTNDIIPTCKLMMYHNLTAAKMVNNYASATETTSTYVGNDPTITSEFSLRRLGIPGSGDFTVSINPITANIVATGTPIAITGLELLEETTESIQYTLGAGTLSGDLISYEIIVNNGVYDSAFLVDKIFGNLIPVFEDPGDSVTDNFINDGWGTTTSTFVSPSSSITDSPSGNYQGNANETITLSDEIDLSMAIGANVSFYAKWDIENNWDYVQIQVSTNNGGNWIPQCGSYTNPGSGNPGQPTGEPLYDGSQNDWIFEEIDLNDYLGENILVRFQLVSDNFQQEDGFYFDDLTINILEDGELGILESQVDAFSIYPNPVTNQLQIITALNKYDIHIYSIQGQLVSKSVSRSGSMSFDYSTFTSGMYLMKLSSDQNIQTFKIVKE